VKELEVWFKSIANLALFEESQVRGHLFTPKKNVDSIEYHDLLSFEKREITKL